MVICLILPYQAAVSEILRDVNLWVAGMSIRTNVTRIKTEIQYVVHVFLEVIRRNVIVMVVFIIRGHAPQHSQMIPPHKKLARIFYLEYFRHAQVLSQKIYMLKNIVKYPVLLNSQINRKK